MSGIGMRGIRPIVGDLREGGTFNCPRCMHVDCTIRAVTFSNGDYVVWCDECGQPTRSTVTGAMFAKYALAESHTTGS